MYIYRCLSLKQPFSREPPSYITAISKYPRTILTTNAACFASVITRRVSRLTFIIFQEYDPITDTKYLPYYTDCSSSYSNVWLGIFYAYKGLMLAFGAFMAWETRNVTVPALNDSRHIGISVYNVVFPCALGMTVVNVVDNNPDVDYAVLSVLVVFCTTITLCFVFIPKVSWFGLFECCNDLHLIALNRFLIGNRHL